MGILVFGSRERMDVKISRSFDLTVAFDSHWIAVLLVVKNVLYGSIERYFGVLLLESVGGTIIRK